jgi:hypothetical protein
VNGPVAGEQDLSPVSCRARLFPAVEAAGFDEGVEDFEDGALVGGGQGFDPLEAFPEAGGFRRERLGERLQDRRPPPLALSAGERQIAKYGNMAGVPVLVALFGLARLIRRRRTMRQSYVPATGVP